MTVLLHQRHQRGVNHSIGKHKNEQYPATLTPAAKSVKVDAKARIFSSGSVEAEPAVGAST